MREMVGRERRERVALFQAVAGLVARVFDVDASRSFGDLVAGYAGEVFQESYDADLLREKIGRLRNAHARIRTKRAEDVRLLARLDKLGDYYDREFGVDLGPKKSRPARPRDPPKRTR